MLLYSTLLCKKIARAPGGHKNICSLSGGGGGGWGVGKTEHIQKKLTMSALPTVSAPMQFKFFEKLKKPGTPATLFCTAHRYNTCGASLSRMLIRTEVADDSKVLPLKSFFI